MNKKFFAGALLLAGTVFAVRGQSTFQNLGFEAAQNLPVTSGAGATANLLPGWQAFSGVSELSAIAYNLFTAVPEVGLYSSLPIAGNFDVLLSRSGSISQIGVIPDDAKSVIFKGSWNSMTPLGVSLGGQSLSYAAISNTPNYTVYGADISAFAGQPAKLAFFSPSLSLYSIDDIQFSPQMIPEPSISKLLGLCGFLPIVVRTLRRCRRPRAAIYRAG